jgi:hypothetical protein
MKYLMLWYVMFCHAMLCRAMLFMYVCVYNVYYRYTDFHINTVSAFIGQTMFTQGSWIGSSPQCEICDPVKHTSQLNFHCPLETCRLSS